MARTESSAVNDLIDLVARRPLGRDSADDLLFARPLEPANSSNRPARRPSPVRIVPAPPERPMPQLRLVPAGPAAPQPVIRAVRDRIDQTMARTIERKLHSATSGRVLKIAVPLVVLVIAGVVIGRIAFTRAHEDTKPVAITVSAPPPPAITTPVAQPATPAPKPIALVDVRIDSQPQGTTVTLVDGAKSTFLGTTPVSASVDPSRTYDVVFTRDGQPSHAEHLDPKVTQRLTIALEAPAAPPPAPALAIAKTETAPAAAPKKHHHHRATHTAKKAASKPTAKSKKHA